MFSATLELEGTPLPELADRLLAAALPGLSIHAYYGDTPALGGCAAEGGERLLFWGLEPGRMRVGPLLDRDGESCLKCLHYWLDHNRPDAELWGALPGPGSPELADFPWSPLHFGLLEAVSADFVAEDSRRCFVDIEPATLTVESHRYPPSPGCERCTPKVDDCAGLARVPAVFVAKLGPAKFRSRTMPGAEELRRHYVDYRVGLVRHMYRELMSDLLPVWGAECKLPKTAISEIGFGRNESVRTAESVAILEALERFCGFLPRRRRSTVRGSYAGLKAKGERVIDPRVFLLSDESQREEPGYQLAPYSAELVYDWVWAFSYRAMAPVLIPQQFCFYGPATPAREHFVFETSNGCALGSTLEEATFHGLLEVIERDAYMARWYTRGTPARIELDDEAMPDVRRLYARATADGYELSAFAINLEIPIPTVLAMIVDPREGAAVASYCASAAHPNGAAAVMGALVEVCSSIGIYQRPFAAERDQARALFEDASRVQTMRDHVLLYSLPESLKWLAFLEPRAESVRAASVFARLEQRWTGGDLTAELSVLIAAVSEISEDVLIVDQTASMLDPLGLHAVKVLAPGLLPVTFGHQYRRIGSRRLDSAREYLARKGEASVPGINPFPHNFP